MKTRTTSVWRQLVVIGKPYWVSGEKWQALGLLGLLLLLLAGVNALNVILNFANGAIMNALAARNLPLFTAKVWLLLEVFVVGVFIVVLYKWVRDKLGLTWRRWLTNSILQKYFASRNYYHINNDASIDNPDERIAQDIDGFVKGALSLFLSLLDSIITLCAFITILYGISKLLVVIAVGWAIVFTLITIWVGKRLVKLNFDQSRKEADFRYNLIHVRKNAESIAFYGGEGQESARVRDRLSSALMNFNLLIGWTRNLQFLVKGSDYFTVAIPFLVIGPLYFAKQVELGTISQASMAFGQVLAALTIVVSEFSTVSQFTAYVKRLASFTEALEPKVSSGSANDSIKTTVAERIALHDLTLKTPDHQRVLIDHLNLTVDECSRLLVMGRSGRGKSSLLRAIAGLWTAGKGTIERPGIDQVFFLPQRPYMVLGTLRDQLLYPFAGKDVTDAQLEEILRTVNLPDLVKHSGGLDAELNWADALSLGEQQRVAFARLLVSRPKFAILDEATSALDAENEAHLYETLTSIGTIFISVGHRPSLRKYHQSVLELTGETGWKVTPSSETTN
jgi:putative ATP-binding cassette transporter